MKRTLTHDEFRAHILKHGPTKATTTIDCDIINVKKGETFEFYSHSCYDITHDRTPYVFSESYKAHGGKFIIETPAISKQVKTLASKHDAETLLDAHNLRLEREQAEKDLEVALTKRAALNKRIVELRGVLK